MAFVFKDGASSTIAFDVSNTSTVMTLESVASFPMGLDTGTDYTIATISNSDNTLREVVKITSINYALKRLTVQRGYDSTIALNWPANSKIEIRAGSSLLKELATTSSAMVLIDKKTLPTRSRVLRLESPKELFSANNEFRRYRIEIQNLFANNSMQIYVSPTITTDAFNTLAAGTYPRDTGVSVQTYLPSVAGYGNTGLGEVKYLNGTTQNYLLLSSNQLGGPLLNYLNTSGWFDTYIDITISPMSFNTTTGVFNARFSYNIETFGIFSSTSTPFIHKVTYEHRISNFIQNVGTNTSQKYVGFTIHSANQLFADTDYSNSTDGKPAIFSLYGIR